MLEFTKAPFEDDLNIDNWPRWCADHCDIEKVRKQNNQLVNTILDHVPLVGNHNNVVVDVRTQYLAQGYCTLSASDWHIDDDTDSTALHHIYVIGKNRTEFLVNGDVITIPTNHYATYDNDSWHRGVDVHIEELRLLVRIQECESFIHVTSSKDLLPFYPSRFPVDGEPYSISEDEYLGYFDE